MGIRLMSRFHSKVAEATTPASVFAAHYEFLMDWALRFAQSNHAVAEDLVQQTFIKFVTSPPAADELVRDAKPLLYTYLKNVHGAELRKAQRHPIQSMTTIEFDSLQMSLRERGGVSPIELQDELRNIVSYLCWRKESLKPASILLLRFFYSYTPDEIMRICLMSRQSIDHGLSTAREEVRNHIRSTAGGLGVVRHGGPPPTASKHVALRVDHFMEELELLSQERDQACVSRVLHCSATITARPRKALSSTLLAHIVSCTQCLARVHEFYNFPDVSDKGSKTTIEMTKRLNFSPGRKKDSRASKPDVSRLLGVASSRSRERHEHRP